MEGDLLGISLPHSISQTQHADLAALPMVKMQQKTMGFMELCEDFDGRHYNLSA